MRKYCQVCKEVKGRSKLNIQVLMYLVTAIWQHEYFLNNQVTIEVTTE